LKLVNGAIINHNPRFDFFTIFEKTTIVEGCQIIKKILPDVTVLKQLFFPFNSKMFFDVLLSRILKYKISKYIEYIIVHCNKKQETNIYKLKRTLNQI